MNNISFYIDCIFKLLEVPCDKILSLFISEVIDSELYIDFTDYIKYINCQYLSFIIKINKVFFNTGVFQIKNTLGGFNAFLAIIKNGKDYREYFLIRYNRPVIIIKSKTLKV